MSTIEWYRKCIDRMNQQHGEELQASNNRTNKMGGRLCDALNEVAELHQQLHLLQQARGKDLEDHEKLQQQYLTITSDMRQLLENPKKFTSRFKAKYGVFIENSPQTRTWIFNDYSQIDRRVFEILWGKQGKSINPFYSNPTGRLTDFYSGRSAPKSYWEAVDAMAQPVVSAFDAGNEPATVVVDTVLRSDHKIGDVPT